MATLKAYSKVNLVLKVFPKQGRSLKHKIHSLMVLDKTLYDQITITPSDSLSITYHNNKTITKINNCAVAKSITYLQKKLKIKLNYHIEIYKQIPLMSGLGGSATDAASVMLYILKHYQKQLTTNQLKHIALNIGSDIPFFLSQLNTAEVKGYGDQVHKLNVSGVHYSAILTHIPVLSQRVYSTLDKDPNYQSKVNFKKCLAILQQHKPIDICFNDLQPYIWKVSKLLQYKYNSINTMNNTCIITGSGGTIIKIWK